VYADHAIHIPIIVQLESNQFCVLEATMEIWDCKVFILF
jgi:hypothetical protein